MPIAEMADEDSGSFMRASPLSGMLGRRGRFSLTNSELRSEIPQNTVVFHPANVLFQDDNDGCLKGRRIRRFFRRNKKACWTCLSVIACFSALILLLGSLSYHLHRRITEESSKPTVQVADVKVPVKPQNEVPSKVISIDKDEDENVDDGGRSIESFLPSDGEPLKHRVPVEVLIDSREIEELKSNININLLKNEFEAAKGRFRRHIPHYESKFHPYLSCENGNCEQKEPVSVRSKLDALLDNIMIIKARMKAFEDNLDKYKKTLFEDFEMTHTTTGGESVTVIPTDLKVTTPQPEIIHDLVATQDVHYESPTIPNSAVVSPSPYESSIDSNAGESMTEMPTETESEDSTDQPEIVHDLTVTENNNFESPTIPNSAEVSSFPYDSSTDPISTATAYTDVNEEPITTLDYSTETAYPTAIDNEDVSSTNADVIEAEDLTGEDSEDLSDNSIEIDSSASDDDEYNGFVVFNAKSANNASDQLQERSTTEPYDTTSIRYSEVISDMPEEETMITAKKSEDDVTEPNHGGRSNEIDVSDIVTSTEAVQSLTERNRSPELSHAQIDEINETTTSIYPDESNGKVDLKSDDAPSTEIEDGTSAKYYDDVTTILPDESSRSDLLDSSPSERDDIENELSTPSFTEAPKTAFESDDSSDNVLEAELTTTRVESMALPGIKMSKSLEDELLSGVKEKSSHPAPESENNVHGISLQEAQARKLSNEERKKWQNKVVSGGNDINLPTGPDHSLSMGEALNTGQQVSYGPSASAHFMMPYHMCFFAPSGKGSPTIRRDDNEQERAFEMHSLKIQPDYPFGVKFGPDSTPAPSHPASAGQPQQNFFSFFMNNNPRFPSGQMGMPQFPPNGQGYFQPAMYPYRYGSNAPLFCSIVQAPTFQFPTMSGSAEYNHAKCLNCNESKIQKDAETVGTERTISRASDRGSLLCPGGTSRCKDDLLCIPSEQWCDGRVHCSDASDELFCSCRDRISETKHCDGYVDCPEGEDELGCFDCPVTTFSCGTWDQSNSCIPLNNRCDGRVDCHNGHDEEGCSIISPELNNISHQVSYDEGFLLRNWRGAWHPVCSEQGHQSWAQQACAMFADDRSGDIDWHHADIPENFKGLFLTHLDDGNFVLQHHCKGHLAVHVQCPSSRCGTRSKMVEEDTTEFATRFRRLVEEGDRPTIADETFIKWWSLLKERVEKQYHLENVVARLYPVKEDADRKKRYDNLRVVGGRSSSPHDWPWAIALYRDGGFLCGGVVLDPNWIMTAAHCVTKYPEHFYQVRAGMLRRFSFSPMEQIRTVVNIIANENYDRHTMKNDIAVLKLDRPFLMNMWVRPICLPVAKSDGVRDRADMPPVPGSNCVAVGWGALKEHGTDPDQLREVILPIMSHCKHKEDEDGREICAGYKQGGRDTCQGDSGGPLMCRDSSHEGVWYLAGLVSHGDGCARPNEPGAYTRVSLYIDWLAKNTARNSYPKSTRPKITCPGFQCRSHPGLCVPSKYRCNGLVDCLDAEDEKNCVSDRNDFVDEFYVSRAKAMKRQEISPQADFFNYSLPKPFLPSFRCESLVQRIPGGRRCDGIPDCLDSSDERNCTCRERIAVDRPTAICSGIVECADRSDEEDCFTCPNDYFNCRKSHQCLHVSRRCDGSNDCSYKEDETNCFALSNENSTLVIDPFGDPMYSTRGTLIENANGIWSVACRNETDFKRRHYPSKVCHELGLVGFEKYSPIRLNDFMLTSKDSSSSFLSPTIVESVKRCSGLYVECSKRIETQENAAIDLLNWDWDAKIRGNGSYLCDAVIVTSRWLLGSVHCLSNTSDIENTYFSAEMGMRILPPTFMRIASLRTVSNILLFQLERPIDERKYLRPIQIPIWENTNDFKSCMAISNHQFVSLSVQEHCPKGEICFSRPQRPHRGCRSEPWIGVAVCNSDNGWFPAGTFREVGGACGFQRVNMTNVLNFIDDIKTAIESPSDALQETKCNGLRCLEGLCVPFEKVCDGWPQCMFNDDEREEQCTGGSKNSDCNHLEIKCSNGQCVNRSKFMDTIEDCSDGSDEPSGKSCAEYLRLVAPHRLCDGSRNCHDKSDESSCPCRNNTFKCNSTSSDECIPRQFMCDGHEDCPNGDDESECFGLFKIPFRSKLYEYQNMSYGMWHTVCDSKLSYSEADVMCRKAGHSHAQSLDIRSVLPQIPVLDPFSDIKLNNVTKFAVRGDRQFVVLQTGKVACPVTYITCS